MTDSILAEARVTAPDTEMNAHLEEIVRRGLIEVQRRKIDRYKDRHDRSHHDDLFDAAQPPAVTFSELINVYLGEKEQEYALNGISRKRSDKVRATVAVLKEIVGGGAAVHTIDDDVVQQVRSLLAKLPANKKKLYPSLTLLQAIEKGEKSGTRLLSPLTQSSYLSTFRDVLKVAVRKKLLPANPAAEIRPLKRDTVPLDQKRLPWTSDQIRSFFGGKFYQSCAPNADQPYRKLDRAWRFWFPLIMLFSGARPNEIAQLHVSDILRTKSGTWYIKCTDDDGRSLKTGASRRRVPIHPELIRIGFLWFVEQRRIAVDKNGPYLFHELRPNKYGNRAWYAVRRLNEVFIPAEIDVGEKQALYSLRHNVRDALRRIKAPSETLLAVTGWSPAGKAVSDGYGDPGNPDLHVECVTGIAYDGLDLSFLHLPDTPAQCG